MGRKGDIILYEIVRKAFSNKVVFAQKPERSKGTGCDAIWHAIESVRRSVWPRKTDEERVIKMRSRSDRKAQIGLRA